MPKDPRRQKFGKTVLLADDNERIRNAACSLLLGCTNLGECIEAENGLEAVQKAKALQPDLVILDFSMPVMDGLEAARRIHQEFPRVPIVLFSMHGSVLKPEVLQQMGITAMVSKENVTTKLVETVELLLNLPHALGAA